MVEGLNGLCLGEWLAETQEISKLSLVFKLNYCH